MAWSYIISGIPSPYLWNHSWSFGVCSHLCWAECWPPFLPKGLSLGIFLLHKYFCCSVPCQSIQSAQSLFLFLRQNVGKPQKDALALSLSPVAYSPPLPSPFSTIKTIISFSLTMVFTDSDIQTERLMQQPACNTPSPAFLLYQTIAWRILARKGNFMKINWFWERKFQKNWKTRQCVTACEVCGNLVLL